MSKLYSYSYPFLLNVINLHSKTLMADVSWEKNTTLTSGILTKAKLKIQPLLLWGLL